jgi:hypothetical protein
MLLLLPIWLSYQRPQLQISSFLELLAMVQRGPFPTFARAKMVELSELAWMVSFADSLFFDMHHIPEPISLHLYLW